MPPTCAYGAGRGHFHGLGPLWDLSAAARAAVGVPDREPARRLIPPPSRPGSGRRLACYAADPGPVGPGAQVLTVRYCQPPHVLTLVVSFELWTYSERTRNLWSTAWERLSCAATALLEPSVKQPEVLSVCQAPL